MTPPLLPSRRFSLFTISRPDIPRGDFSAAYTCKTHGLFMIISAEAGAIAAGLSVPQRFFFFLLDSGGCSFDKEGECVLAFLREHRWVWNEGIFWFGIFVVCRKEKGEENVKRAGYNVIWMEKYGVRDLDCLCVFF